jgi:hypothetical protein
MQRLPFAQGSELELSLKRREDGSTVGVHQVDPDLVVCSFGHVRVKYRHDVERWKRNRSEFELIVYDTELPNDRELPGRIDGGVIRQMRKFEFHP